ncbi:MAG: polysaccharide deacetylase family protein [Chloroflexota bacterium]|nr:polysaccharide deacetylase family protein [Chloroflexota bacterium]MDQ5865463.1 polysaccharide deacetylase family protein [Chloroflexota bacterium]
MPASSFTVLSYHRIAEPGCPDLADSLIDASPAAFEEQMRHVALHYNVVSSWDVVRAFQEGYTLPRRALVITFDDGYRCFMDTAMPVLKRLGLPVTLFVATHVAGGTASLFWWDELYRTIRGTGSQQLEVAGLGMLPLGDKQERSEAFSRIVSHFERLSEDQANALLTTIVECCGVEPNRERYLLDWDELRALEAEGVAIGPHTRHHPILAQAAPGRVISETRGSWRDLTTRLQRPLPIFCYPNGREHAVNRTAMDAVREAGLAAAFTTVPGLNVAGKTDPYRLFRIGATGGESLRHFAIKLSPAGRVYRGLKSMLHARRSRNDAG